MASATGLRRKLNPALLAGAPYREGEVMAGRYEIKDAVGVGPLGFVLRAQDRELGIDVSVKLVHPRLVQTGEEREAFARALEPARRFLHPSLTRLHDVGNDQGWPYFTYTFLDGLPLRRIIDSRLAKGQTFALDEVEPILGQLMSALEAAHPVGAHGDLKAENVVVLPDMLKVTDWGVAGGLPRPPFVQAQRQKAAQRHLAPEYLAGLQLDPRADVYGLGVLVGEMLTGLTPEDEIPELRLVNPDLPDALEGFYRRALSERPESRFRSVREMFQAFAAVAEGKPAAAEDVVEDGFEVVDVVEAPPAAVPESLAPAPSAEPPLAAPVQAAAAETPAPASTPEPEEVKPPPEPAETALDAAAPSDAGPGAVEDDVPAAAEAAAAEQTLWSEEDEEHPDTSTPTEAEQEELAAAAAAAEEPVPGPPPPAAPPVELPAPPPVRNLPTPLAGLPRPPAPAGLPRPVVPSIGLWGPGARRTGAHAAVAVAVPASTPEPASAEAPAVHAVAPLGARPSPPRAAEASLPPPVSPLRPVEPPPSPEGATGQAHQGGLWSPGAALAEVVSEVQAEDARRMVADASPPASELAARAVAEQRTARERLALMSASEEPTAPVPSVSSPGRPRKTRPAPQPPAAEPWFGRDRWLRWALLGAVFFVLGMIGAVAILRAR